MASAVKATGGGLSAVALGFLANFVQEYFFPTSVAVLQSQYNDTLNIIADACSR
jgi:hypothetical protein